jgi:hypothetical protein
MTPILALTVLAASSNNPEFFSETGHLAIAAEYVEQGSDILPDAGILTSTAKCAGRS